MAVGSAVIAGSRQVIVQVGEQAYDGADGMHDERVVRDDSHKEHGLTGPDATHVLGIRRQG
ncbi:hypothetical protein GA0070612_3344 [Micromonospora chokoriensis]|uniref:Uncharacterized protein n=1 Tax=Micromonospora chokoriensis TaxID=356851 RepID=A0A1C4X9T6_9ACTN|nr:hypothetical protein GA0070612_3344 [Micromonospora chokoriensis]